jgi:transcription termination factor NusB
MKEISRAKCEDYAVTALYDILTYLDMKEEVDVEGIVSSVSGVPYAEAPLFLKEIVLSSLKNYANIIAAYNAKMNKWTFDRLNRVEQAILIESYAHYHYVETDVDKAVVINVAVKKAKALLDSTDYKFVNAILDKVLNRDAK